MHFLRLYHAQPGPSVKSAQTGSKQISGNRPNPRNFWKSAEPEEVHSCLQAGRSLFERTDDGETPLHLSVAAASPDTVLELLRSGADVSLTTTDGLTPLHVAARDTIHGTVISYLLVYGSEVDKRIPPDLC